MNSYNIAFLLSLVVGGFFMILTAVGGIGDGHDVEHDTGDCDTGDDAFVSRALAILGVGQVPLMLLLTALTLLFGCIGFLCNLILTQCGLPPSVAGLFALVLSIPSSITLARSGSRLFARLLPRTESYGVTNESLLGCRGTAVYTVTSMWGAAVIRDDRGNLQKVAARTRFDECIPAGAAVEVLLYQDEGDYFVVTQVAESLQDPGVLR